MKKIIILLSIIFAMSLNAQSNKVPGTDLKLVYEGTINIPANCPYISIYAATIDTTDVDSTLKAKFAVSVFKDWVDAGYMDTLRGGGGAYNDSLLYIVTHDGVDTFRYVNTGATIAWHNFVKGPYSFMTDKVSFMGEITSTGLTSGNLPNLALMTKYHWVAPTTNLTDATDFVDMEDALEHDLSVDPAAISIDTTALNYLYVKIYGVFMHWGLEAKSVQYKLWMVRIDRRL